jgi:hypothetical protein
LEPAFRWFESSRPSHYKIGSLFNFHSPIYGPLAQLVEHLTFNQGVAGSSPAWLTNNGLELIWFQPILKAGVAERQTRWT